ncbi:hypothetical protein NMY22_g670 [Coprinellus aureogranulatus]|nr:hypothetical protein NMY22_g670 [Coprinellus aureogranulatus]
MGNDLDYLEPKVVQILKAPGTDLATISAKRVRRQLLELDSSLTTDFVREHKEEIDAIISRVFEQVNSENNGDADEAESSDSASRKKRKGGSYDDEDDEDEEEQVKRPAKKTKSSKGGQKLSADEVLARKLSSEINGRPSRAGVKSSTKARTKKSTRKSAATVDSDGEGGSESGSEKKAKRSGGGGGGFKKEFVLSEPLSAILEVPKLSRPQVVKQLWVYIKGNELQNPSNKREIMCDSKMKAVFGVDKIDMFQMNKVLGKHLHEPEEAS